MLRGDEALYHGSGTERTVQELVAEHEAVENALLGELSEQREGRRGFGIE